MQLNLNDIPPEVQQAKMRFGIVGNAPQLIAAITRAIQVAPIDLSVLVTGESGSGKEFFPQIIHAFSPRKHARYIAVNCGAIPEGTIDSELFGHEKGSFTGAVSARKGYFEEADGGTIFADGPAHQHPCGGRHQCRHASGRGAGPFPRRSILPTVDGPDPCAAAA